jgi:hypothetical protein
MNYYLIQSVLILSIVAYFVFEIFEERRTQDEREELIRLKTYQFVQKTSFWTLISMSALYIYDREIPGIIFLVGMLLATLYSEIFGRVFWRNKL